MLRPPCWTVTVTVDGAVVKTFREVAFAPEAAIAKAMRKMLGSVSNAGDFVYSAAPEGK